MRRTTGASVPAKAPAKPASTYAGIGASSLGAAAPPRPPKPTVITTPTSPTSAAPRPDATRRRIWIMRAGGTPTTIMIERDDLVDDVKQAVVAKFPQTLGRIFDASDLSIKMNLEGRSHALKKPSPSPLQPSSSPRPGRVSPDRRHAAAFSLVNLKPDQNVWSLVEQYFPKGMTMEDAFLVEAPEGLDPMYELRPRQYDRSGPPSADAGYASPLMAQQVPRPRQYSIEPAWSGNQGSAAAPYTGYAQPKPQSTFHPLASGDASILDPIPSERSVSPSSSRLSPMLSHRRAHSNPSQSPAPAANAAHNNSAVLLLPKNFSLSTGRSSSPGAEAPPKDKKRLSFDEGYMRKHQENFKSSGSGTNITTIGTALTSPTSDLYQDDEPEKAKSEGMVLKAKQPAPSRAPEHSAKTKPPDRSKLSTDSVLPSISVLVVEDNAINQAILGAFLRKHKIHYKIAKNGQEAVDKWREGGFHLVLMDIQLPVKSGIEATKEIRHLEKINRIGVFAENELRNSHYSSGCELKPEEKLDLAVFRSPVIIVALTASSNSSTDKKKALMAGCNDYLTKPVNLVWLQNKITEWGCMQALIDFDGWNKKRPDPKKAAKTPGEGVLLSGTAT
ncbi:Response regulatory domain-containing protein [[Candida] zeylanoides]